MYVFIYLFIYFYTEVACGLVCSSNHVIIFVSFLGFILLFFYVFFSPLNNNEDRGSHQLFSHFVQPAMIIKIMHRPIYRENEIILLHQPIQWLCCISGASGGGASYLFAASLEEMYPPGICVTM